MSSIATIKNVKSTPISHRRVMITKTSSMKIVRGAANQLLVPQGFDVASLHENGGVLQITFDDQKTFLRNHQAQLFKMGRRHDGVGHAGFIFQADEDKTFGSAAALAADHVAGNAHDLTIVCFNRWAIGTPQRAWIATRRERTFSG
jgi:hypothetical protein